MESEQQSGVVPRVHNIVARTKYSCPHYCSMATQCQDCDLEASKDDGRIVSEIGHYGPVCNECWAIFLRQETVLSEREAEVTALFEMDLPKFEIADTLDIDESTVRTYLDRSQTKLVKAERTVDELGHVYPT